MQGLPGGCGTTRRTRKASTARAGRTQTCSASDFVRVWSHAVPLWDSRTWNMVMHLHLHALTHSLAGSHVQNSEGMLLHLCRSSQTGQVIRRLR